MVGGAVRRPVQFSLVDGQNSITYLRRSREGQRRFERKLITDVDVEFILRSAGEPCCGVSDSVWNFFDFSRVDLRCGNSITWRSSQPSAAYWPRVPDRPGICLSAVVNRRFRSS